MTCLQQAGLVSLLGYLIGCLNPAYLIGRIRGYDVFSSGSGNAGASNTVIMAGKAMGLLVALTDIGKAAAAWWLGAKLFPNLRHAGILGGVAAVYGHMFPVYLRFRGGKGLACLGGLCLACDPRFLLLLLPVALLIALLSKYVSISTVVMSWVVPASYGWLSGDWIGAVLLALPAPVIFWKHLPNFRRIRAGEELQFRFLWNRGEELRRIGREEDE